MTKLVATLLPLSVEEGLEACRRAQRAGADLVEFRLDHLRDPGMVRELVRRASAPVLASCRVPEDGGFFRGSPHTRRAFLAAAVEGGAEWIDLEHWEGMSLPSGTRTRVLRSFHRLQGPPRDLREVLERMARSGADALKIVWMAYDAADLEELASIPDFPPELPVLSFLAGEAGLPTRFLAALRGAPFLYCAPGPGLEAAPGQPTLFDAAERWRARELGPDTRFWGLCGSPVGHSLGFRLHNGLHRWLREVPLYLPFDTKDPERLVRALRRRHGSRFLGLSVTAPHKERVLSLCEDCDADARAAGAVNTLIHREGRLLGANTDVEGLRLALRRGFEGALPAGLRALVLGGGGAARAAVVALRKEGAEVFLALRGKARIKEFAARWGVPLLPLDERSLRHVRPEVLVQATPFGQRGSELEGRIPFDLRDLPEGCVVLDLVYNPVRTPLLVEAARRGGVPVPGLWMFLHQAVLQADLVLGGRLRLPGLDALTRLLGPAGRELRRVRDLSREG